MLTSRLGNKMTLAVTPAGTENTMPSILPVARLLCDDAQHAVGQFKAIWNLAERAGERSGDAKASTR